MIAFQSDMTRVITFLGTHEGLHAPIAKWVFPTAIIPRTHHQNKPDLMEKVSQINEDHTKQLAGFLEKMKATRDGDSSLLDNSMIVYGAGLSDGNRHLCVRICHITDRPRRRFPEPGTRIVYRKETQCAICISR